MTPEEARLFFPYNEADDVTDLYNERLFEHKQFFLSKTPIRRVFESRLDKVAKMDEAYHVITGKKVSSGEEKSEEITRFPDHLLTAFTQWEQLKGRSKQRIMQSQSASALCHHVHFYLRITDEYRLKWHTDQEIDIEISQLSKDEDPMDVLRAIRAFEQDGGVNFEDILKMNTNSFLLKEMKRLSLLVKNYGNGGSI